MHVTLLYTFLLLNAVLDAEPALMRSLLYEMYTHTCITYVRLLHVGYVELSEQTLSDEFEV